jgi:hypothetical protein
MMRECCHSRSRSGDDPRLAQSLEQIEETVVGGLIVEEAEFAARPVLSLR